VLSHGTSPPPRRQARRPITTRAILATTTLVSSLYIFGTYLTALAFLLFFICYFTGTRPPTISSYYPSVSVSSLPRRRLRGIRTLTRSFITNVNARRPHFSQLRQLKQFQQLKRLHRPRFRMYLSRISRKHLLQKGKAPFRPLYRPLYGASSRASTAFARCWSHGTNKTSALISSVKSVKNLKGFRKGIKRAAYYSTTTGGRGGENFQSASAGTSPGPGFGSGVPLYRELFVLLYLLQFLTLCVSRSNHCCVDGNAYKMVHTPHCRGCGPARSHSVP